jgi:hypothetical protein
MNEQESIIPMAWYYYIHQELKKRFGEFPQKLKDIKRNLIYSHRIPKQLVPVILKEMEKLNLIKVKSESCTINKCCYSIMNNTSKLYHKVGLW